MRSVELPAGQAAAQPSILNPFEAAPIKCGGSLRLRPQIADALVIEDQCEERSGRNEQPRKGNRVAPEAQPRRDQEYRGHSEPCAADAGVQAVEPSDARFAFAQSQRIFLDRRHEIVWHISALDSQFAPSARSRHPCGRSCALQTKNKTG